MNRKSQIASPANDVGTCNEAISFRGEDRGVGVGGGGCGGGVMAKIAITYLNSIIRYWIWNVKNKDKNFN